MSALLDLMLGFRFTLWRNLCASLLYFVICVCRCRQKSSLLLSYPLTSFLFSKTDTSPTSFHYLSCATVAISATTELLLLPI